MKLAAIIIFCLAVPAIGSSATLLVPSQHPTIQGAIDAALNGDTVLVSPGTYVENIDFKGKTITVTSVNGASVTVIDGNQNDSVAIFQSGEGLATVLDGFTLTNGSGNFSGGVTRGGGIYCVNTSSPTIVNNIITKNTATYGGGLYPRFNSAPEIMHNIISENSADELGGGIISFEAAPVITSNVISNNYSHQEGGAMLCKNFSSPIIKNNTITGNSALIYGGGIEFAYDCTLIIENNVITNNTALTDCGGGIIVAHNCTGTVANNIVAWNSSNESGLTKWCGSGVVLGDNCSLTISNNLIYGNSAARGGGIDVYLYSSAIISNNTIIGNSAGINGGGIACRNNSTVTITDTILWDNTAPSGPEVLIASQPDPSTVTISYSDLEGGQASVQNNGGILNWGPGMIDADPLFAAGASGFHYLGQLAAGQPADSPCVDTGSAQASNLGMDVYWTRTDEVTDSGMVDMGYHYGDFLFPCLQADTFAIQQSTGGEANLLLLAGSENANRNYIILGSVTGTDPGTPLPGGKATLPLNWDIFTNLVIDMINTPIFLNFMGPLNAEGSANAKFDTLGPVPPAAAGIILYFAYALNGPWDFVSNPVEVEIL